MKIHIRSVSVLLVVFLGLLAFHHDSSSASQKALSLKPLAGYPGEYRLLKRSDQEGPSTITTVFRYDATRAEDAPEVIYLAGWTSSIDQPPTALTIIWSEDRSGWIPSWKLSVMSDFDLLPANMDLNKGTGFLRDALYVNAQTMAPLDGHVYETKLSYDPLTGDLAVRVFDLTANRRLLSRAYTLNSTDQSLYPAFGVVGNIDAVELHRFAVYPYWVPLATPLNLVTMDNSGSYVRMTLYRLMQATKLALNMDAQKSSGSGTYILSADDGSKITPLLHLEGNESNQGFIASIPELPLGEITLNLDYTTETGDVYELEKRSLFVVAGDVDIQFSALEMGGNHLRGLVGLTGLDTELEDIGFTLVAFKGYPDEKGAELIYRSERYVTRLTQDSVTVPVVIPLCVETDRRVFSLNLDIEFDIPVGKVVSGNEFHILVTP